MLTATFLALNGVTLAINTDAAYRLVMSVATGQYADLDKLATSLRRRNES